MQNKTTKQKYGNSGYTRVGNCVCREEVVSQKQKQKQKNKTKQKCGDACMNTRTIQ